MSWSLTVKRDLIPLLLTADLRALKHDLDQPKSVLEADAAEDVVGGDSGADALPRSLATTDQPTLTGAGNHRAPAPNRNAAVRLANRQPPSSRLTAQPVSYTIADAGTLGIYSTGNVAHVAIQRPLTRDEATSEALSDVDYMFDGLNQHPNLLVALPAAAVATPISLWKQGAALMCGFSPRTIEEAEARLSKAADETRPHQQLALQVSQPVMLVQ